VILLADLGATTGSPTAGAVRGRVRIQTASAQALSRLTRRHGVVVWDAVSRHPYLDPRTGTGLFTLAQLVTRVMQT